MAHYTVFYNKSTTLVVALFFCKYYLGLFLFLHFRFEMQNLRANFSQAVSLSVRDLQLG